MTLLRLYARYPMSQCDFLEMCTNVLRTIAAEEQIDNALIFLTLAASNDNSAGSCR